MGLPQLDAFLRHAQLSPAISAELAEPLDLASFLALARREGFEVEEADLLQARERDEAQRTAAELQQRAGAEARRLRSFIHG
ncbi:Nif11-like leader peptide family RiPP precursor [Synechococcus sp. CS-1325]|uniref:Nif11-like leader peptide family RiPP precursor n=1 Tax=unclassified Synechococcus TaxID=2626047 RepID=UPI000DB1CBBD|nr:MULTISPECIES: Nif11-like leader peptide family RiPP precursor [unclassified Synechococcus]MCT0198640.1 Nif11-like leader peptide family RiPP precursor [Synechococcus sp. CS-1325]MCT0212765.1 Nif11-like leader peptide family RiPP precursor [Synechococcus sp. CS-1326]MCT0232597.1 Nif11-like leader peptide family RiPP precursor [Synechococcus sp. CS-1327]PZV02114.1 MAG: bacteriocin [Cyanobium sp.]